MREMELLEVIKAFRTKKGYSPSNAELAKLMGVSEVMIWKYVRKLRRAKLVKVLGHTLLQVGNEIPYSEKLLTIMRMIVKNPQIRQAQIAAKLGISRPTVFEHIHRLKAFGAIREAKDGFKILDKSISTKNAKLG